MNQEIKKKNTTVKNKINEKSNDILRINNFKKSIKKKKKELKELKLRHLAHIDNLYKNNKKEIQKIKKEIFKNFFFKIIPIIEKLENYKINFKNFEICENSILEGLRLTQKSIKNILSSWKIKKINNKKELFNEKKHENISKTKTILKSKKILNIVENGYTFKKKIIKKAKVTIKK